MSTGISQDRTCLVFVNFNYGIADSHVCRSQTNFATFDDLSDSVDNFQKYSNFTAC